MRSDQPTFLAIPTVPCALTMTVLFSSSLGFGGFLRFCGRAAGGRRLAHLLSSIFHHSEHFTQPLFEITEHAIGIAIGFFLNLRLFQERIAAGLFKFLAGLALHLLH